MSMNIKINNVVIIISLFIACILTFSGCNLIADSSNKANVKLGYYEITTMTYDGLTDYEMLGKLVQITKDKYINSNYEETTYKIKGDKINVIYPEGNLVGTILDDTITFEYVINYKKILMVLTYREQTTVKFGTYVLLEYREDGVVNDFYEGFLEIYKDKLIIYNSIFEYEIKGNKLIVTEEGQELYFTIKNDELYVDQILDDTRVQIKFKYTEQATVKLGYYEVTQAIIYNVTDINLLGKVYQITENQFIGPDNNIGTYVIKGNKLVVTDKYYEYIYYTISGDLLTISYVINGEEYLIELTYREQATVKLGTYEITEAYWGDREEPTLLGDTIQITETHVIGETNTATEYLIMGNKLVLIADENEKLYFTINGDTLTIIAYFAGLQVKAIFTYVEPVSLQIGTYEIIEAKLNGITDPNFVGEQLNITETQIIDFN